MIINKIIFAEITVIHEILRQNPFFIEESASFVEEIGGLV